MKGNQYTIFSIVTDLLEEAVLILVVFWLLPEFGINIPLWGFIFMATSLGAYSYIAYRLGKEALNKKPIIVPDIGSRGRTTTPVTPNGYVRVGNELWKASAMGSVVDANKEVVIVGIEGMTLLINSLERTLLSDHGN